MLLPRSMAETTSSTASTSTTTSERSMASSWSMMPSSASSSSSSSASPSTASSWTKVSFFCVFFHHIEHRRNPLLHRIAINVLSVHPHHLRKKHNLRCSTRQQLIHENGHTLFS